MPGRQEKTNYVVTLFSVFFLIIFCQPALSQRSEEQAKPPTLDHKMRTGIVEGIGKLLLDKYIFPEKGKEMQNFLLKQLKEGKYDKIESVYEFGQALTRDMQSVSEDKHLRVVYDPEQVRRIRAHESRSDEEREKERRKSLERERRQNFGFQRLELLDGNIGYLDLRYFSDNREAGVTAVAAMNFFANANAFIVDLRQNGGGSPAMIQLLSSYFLEEPTHLNSFEWRGEEGLRQFWSLPYVPGKTMKEMDLYILTSGRTFSAAEEFTYNLKNLKRATIVGETTGGGAHPGGLQIVNDDFLVWIPSGRAINPITKTNWEGTGIEPHVSVPKEQALDKAHSLALEKLISKAADEEKRFALKWALDGLKARTDPAKVNPETLKKYAGRYSNGEVSLENDQLVVHIGPREFRMIPISETFFVLEAADNTRAEFVLDEKGDVKEVIVHFRDGRRDYQKRLQDQQ